MIADTLSQDSMRWHDYLIFRGAEFISFWSSHGNEDGRRILFIVGRGFDPRTVLGITRLADAANRAVLDILALDLQDDGAAATPEQKAAAAANWQALQVANSGRGGVSSVPVAFRTDDGRRVAARSAANVIGSADAVEHYTDVVVDISAMPRVVYIPLISRLLFFYDQLHHAKRRAPNIHVIVSDDPHLDSLIQEQGIEETASYLHPFEGPFNREAKSDRPTVWIPVLGEGRTTQFDRIYDLVKPAEVCPVLPSPSRNPRRSDDIVIEYQSLLFDQVRIDPRNIIYGSEYNPFEVYRQIRRATLHYHHVLDLIGGCKVALSSLCSKLMSLGVILVAYELKSSAVAVGVAHIECQSYDLPLTTPIETEEIGLWIAGECYEV